MASRCPAPPRAARSSHLPRVASLGLAAAVVAPALTAVPALAAPGGGSAPLPMTPLPATPRTMPLPTSPIAATPLPATPLPTTPTTNSTVTRYVTTGANVRSGPGTQYSVVGGLAKDARVTGSYTNNGWFDLGDGKFVSASLLTATAPGQSAPPSASTVTRWTTTGTNVRSGPGTNYGIVGGLAQGAQVTGTMTSNGWLDMGSGRFVYGGLLTDSAPGQPAPTPPAPTPPAPTPPPSTPPPGDTVTGWTTAGVNVRSGPGTSYSIVGGLAQGVQVTGTMTSNGWLDLGSGRFVSGDYVGATPPGDPSPTPPATPPVETVTRYATATANVRSGPGTNYSVVGTVTAGTQVTGTMTSNGWLQMANNRFVSGTLLSPDAPGVPAPAPAPGTVTGAQILAEAAKYAGVPYVWGGSTPAGFDCSGYTSYVFAQLGIQLPRTAAQQRNATPYISDPRPGDLIFFGAPAYHVGIYAGNGMLWDAGRPGVPVQLRQIWNSNDISYGRVPGVSA